MSKKSERPLVVSAEFVAAASAEGSLPPPTLLEIAFAGRSNVGKSTLMNALLHRKGLVRTSSTPGCTRGINFFRAELRGGALLHLVDLPGYGYAKRSKSERVAWGELIEGYLLERPTLAVVVLLVDVRRGLEEDDLDLLELVASEPRVSRHPVKTVVVATKTDKVKASDRKLALRRVATAAQRAVVGFGMDEASAVWRALLEATGIEAG